MPVRRGNSCRSSVYAADTGCGPSSRGGVADADLARLRAAGFDDGEIAEIVAHVALNVLTNYLNRVAETEIDFPKVAALAPSAAL